MIKLQKILFHFSWLILFSSLFLHLLPESAGIPLFLSLLMSVLLTGAIGFLTNFLAIEMLFKPYTAEDAALKNILHRSFWNNGGLLKLLTLGIWRTGLVSANKSQIGKKLGEEIPARLLNEEDLAESLLEGLPMLPSRQPEFFTGIRDMLLQQTVQSPEFLSLCTGSLSSLPPGRLLSPEILSENLKKYTRQWFDAEENQTRLFGILNDEIEKNIEFLRNLIREAVENGARSILQKQSPLLAMLGGNFLENMLSGYDWTQLDGQIREKLQSEAIRQKFQDFCRSVPVKLDDWCAGDEGHRQLEAWSAELSRTLTEKFPEILRTLGEAFLYSEEFRNWFQDRFMPAMQNEFRNWLQNCGKEQILAMLNLSGRIEQAVAEQDVREFHQMVNAVADRHLCAIQILGFFIGMVIGLIQLL